MARTCASHGTPGLGLLPEAAAQAQAEAVKPTGSPVVRKGSRTGDGQICGGHMRVQVPAIQIGQDPTERFQEAATHRAGFSRFGRRSRHDGEAGSVRVPGDGNPRRIGRTQSRFRPATATTGALEQSGAQG